MSSIGMTLEDATEAVALLIAHRRDLPLEDARQRAEREHGELIQHYATRGGIDSADLD